MSFCSTFVPSRKHSAIVYWLGVAVVSSGGLSSCSTEGTDVVEDVAADAAFDVPSDGAADAVDSGSDAVADGADGPSDDGGLADMAPPVACEIGYIGPDCEDCYPGYHDDGTSQCVLDLRCQSTTCSGDEAGTCDDSSGSPVCTCNDGYLGDHCERCDTLYVRDAELACVPAESCDELNPCGEHGTCVDEAGFVTCQCDVGYSGAACDVCAAGAERNAISGLCEASCPAAGQIRCDDQCVLATTNEHCGGCGNDCHAGSCDPLALSCQCLNVAFELCDTGCFNVENDENNCGSCGNACAAGEKCVGGFCVLEGGDCTNSRNEYTCNESRGCCDDGCRNANYFLTDEANCGGCGHACTGDEVCVAGVCQTNGDTCGDCGGGFCCGDSSTCVANFSNDVDHCGACDNACAPGEVCLNGACRCAGTRCDDSEGGPVCADTQTDPDHCGACGATCGDGAVCLFGQCHADTGTGCEGNCGLCCDDGAGGGACLSVERLGADAGNCGGCGVTCADGEVCVEGHCRCNVATSHFCDGVCVPNDAANCGSCGQACDGDEICVGDQCTCPAVSTYATCHGLCTNIGRSNANCGACDNACEAGERCIAGQCQAQADCGGACGDDQLCCDGAAAPVCLDIVTLATDADHCGGCGACAATEACVDNQCCERNGRPVNGNCCNRDVDGNGQCGNQDQYLSSGPGAVCVGGNSGCDRLQCLGRGFDQRCCSYDGLPVEPSVPGHPFYCCTDDLDQDGLCGVDSCRPAGESCDPAAPDCCVGRCQTRLANGTSRCCSPDGVSANAAFCCNGDPNGDGVCGP